MACPPSGLAVEAELFNAASHWLFLRAVFAARLGAECSSTEYRTKADARHAAHFKKPTEKNTTEQTLYTYAHSFTHTQLSFKKKKSLTQVQ